MTGSTLLLVSKHPCGCRLHGRKRGRRQLARPQLRQRLAEEEGECLDVL